MSVNVQKFKECAIPIIESKNLVLYNIEVVCEYGMNIIRIIVDDPNTFDIDIDKVAEINNELLDVVNDDIPDEYYLEVTSVGIEREIDLSKDLDKTLGKYIFCSLYEKHPTLKQKEIYGTLLGFNDIMLTLKVKNKTRVQEIEIEITKIAKARLAVEF